MDYFQNYEKKNLIYIIIKSKMGLKAIIGCLCVLAVASDLVTLNGKNYLKETVVLDDGTLAISFYPIQSEQEAKVRLSQSIERDDHHSKNDQQENSSENNLEERPGKSVGRGKRNRHSKKRGKGSDQHHHNSNLVQDQLLATEDQITTIQDNEDTILTTIDFLNTFTDDYQATSEQQDILKQQPAPPQIRQPQQIYIPSIQVHEDVSQNLRSYQTTNIGEQTNDIIGEFNRIYGFSNKIRGDENHITHNSYDNEIYGDNNYISGSGNIVYS